MTARAGVIVTSYRRIAGTPANIVDREVLVRRPQRQQRRLHSDVVHMDHPVRPGRQKQLKHINRIIFDLLDDIRWLT